MSEPLSTDQQFLMVADRRSQEDFDRLFPPGASVPTAGSPPAVSSGGLPSVDALRAQTQPATPAQPSTLEKVGNAVKFVQEKLAVAIEATPPLKYVFEKDAIVGDYMRGLMTGRLQAVKPEDLVEQMAADRVVHMGQTVPAGSTALETVLQWPGGPVWAAAAKTMADMVSPINAIFAPGVIATTAVGVAKGARALKGGKTEKAAPRGETAAETSPPGVASAPDASRSAYTPEQLASQDADALAKQKPEGPTVIDNTETIDLMPLQNAAQRAKLDLEIYDAEPGGFKTAKEAETGGSPVVSGAKSTAPQWYKDLTSNRDAGSGKKIKKEDRGAYMRIERADVDQALEKFSQGELPTTDKERLIAYNIEHMGEGYTETRPYKQILPPGKSAAVNQAFTEEFLRGVEGKRPLADELTAAERLKEIERTGQELKAAKDEATKSDLSIYLASLQREEAKARRGTLEAQLAVATDPQQMKEIRAQIAKIDRKYPATTVEPLAPQKEPAPGAVPMGKQQVSVDFDALTTPEAIEKAKDTLWQAKQAELGGQTVTELERGTKPIPIKDAQLLASWLQTTPEQLIAELRGSQVKMEAIYKDAGLLEAAQAQTTAAAQAFKDGKLSGDAFVNSLSHYEAVGKATSGKGTDAAQTLRIMREEAIQSPLKKYRQAAKQLEKMGVIGKTDGELSALADMILNVDKDVMAKILSKPRWTDYLSEWGYFMYLSSPKTHGVNILGSQAIMPVLAIEERAIAGVSGTVRTLWGATDRVGGGEAVAMVQSYRDAVSAGWRAVADAYRTDGKKGVLELLGNLAEAQRSKIDRGIQPAFTKNSVPERFRDGWLGSFSQGLGATLRSTTTALKTEDALMRGTNYAMEMGAQSIRTAINEGLEPGAAAFQARVDFLKANPTDKMKLAAEHFSEVQIFVDSLGKTGSGVQTILNDHVVTKMVFAPFFKVGANITYQGLERTPILNGFAKGLREDWAAGGARRDLANAKIANSVGVAVLGTTWALNDRITGNGPQNPAARKVWLVNHRPYSVRVGLDPTKDESWVAYNRADPVAAPMGEMADVTMILREAKEGTDLENLPTAMVMAFAKMLESKTWAQGFANFNKMIEDIARGTESSKEAVERFLAKSASSMTVPAGVNWMNKAFFDDTVREVSTYNEQVMNRVPGLSQTLKPKLDFLGNPTLSSDTSVKHHPVTDEINRQGANPAMPPHVIEGIRLTSDELHDLNYAFSKQAQVNGRTLEDGYRALFADQMGPAYSTRTDAKDGGIGKKYLIEDLAAQYRRAAITLFLDSHDEFRQRYLEAVGTKRENLTGERPTDSTLGVVPPRHSPAREFAPVIP